MCTCVTTRPSTPGQREAHLQRIGPGAVWRGFCALEQADIDQQAAAVSQVKLVARIGNAADGAVVGEVQLRSGERRLENP